MANPARQSWIRGTNCAAGPGILSSTCCVRRAEIVKMTACVLIVNADDFGLTEGTNCAIVDAHCKGIVTSTSLLANGYAFDHAVELAHQHPTLGQGVHLTLTEGLPVAQNVPELVGADGKLPLSNQPFVRAL